MSEHWCEADPNCGRLTTPGRRFCSLHEPRQTFAGLIRDCRSANGDDIDEFTKVVLVTAKDRSEASDLVQAEAEKLGWEFEALHDGNAVYEVIDRRTNGQ